MRERPISDRRTREPEVDQMTWELRVWEEPGPHRPDEDGWRTVAWAASHDDARLLARMATEGSDAAVEFAEVWGPPAVETGPTRQCLRFPEPGHEERRDMWRRAAETHFSDGLDDIHPAR